MTRFSPPVSHEPSSAKRGYGYKWQKARLTFIKRNPICAMCGCSGLSHELVVDHIIPHKGDMTLFWQSSNWQTLCKTCHDSTKKRLELSGKVAGCATNGIPLDPNHHWNR